MLYSISQTKISRKSPSSVHPFQNIIFSIYVNRVFALLRKLGVSNIKVFNTITVVINLYNTLSSNFKIDSHSSFKMYLQALFL